MQKPTLRIVAGIALVVAVIIGVDAFGYSVWCQRVERLAHEVAKSPSAWDGKERTTSFDPNAFHIQLDVTPTRVVVYGAKPLTGVVFEPPWYVWSYSVFARHGFERYEAFFRSGFAKSLGLRIREPYNFSLSPTDGFRAHQGWRAVAQSGSGGS